MYFPSKWKTFTKTGEFDDAQFYCECLCKFLLLFTQMFFAIQFDI